VKSVESCGIAYICEAFAFTKSTTEELSLCVFLWLQQCVYLGCKIRVCSDDVLQFVILTSGKHQTMFKLGERERAPALYVNQMRTSLQAKISPGNYVMRLLTTNVEYYINSTSISNTMIDEFQHHRDTGKRVNSHARYTLHFGSMD
jgi:hypothetical protein